MKRSDFMKKIVIDAGHGGKDTGAVGKYVEKEINLIIAMKLQKKLKKHFEVIMTRESDVYVKLSKRTEIANKNDADLFVSIHHNGGVLNARGFEIIKSAFTKSNFAEILNEEFEKVNYKRRDPYVKLNNSCKDFFHVIRATKMPSVITEYDFVDNFIDFDKEVDSIYNAVLKYFNINEKPHWAEKHFEHLKESNIEILEKRFDDNVTRGELFKLLDEILKKVK
jgi:N-acetylmuramoyl-L-alanine amidase